MNKVLEILHLADTEQVQLCLRAGDDLRAAPPVAFQDPIEPAAAQELGWYFREYLGNPFGPSKARAEAAETSMRSLGRLLFQVVFQSSQEAQDCYAAACTDGLANYQLAIISPRPEFLALPWELLNEPQVGYLAPQLSSVVRRTQAGPLPQFAGQLATNQLNVLFFTKTNQSGRASSATLSR